MTTCKNWFAFSASAALLVANAGLAQDLQYHLSSSAIRPGERLVLELSLPASLAKPSGNEEEPELPIVQDDLLTRDTRVQILDRDFRAEKDNLIWKYQMTTYALGRLYIPPMEVKLGPHTYSTEALSVEVTTSRPPGDEAMREEFGAIRPPIQWAFWLKILLGLGFLFGIYALWRRYSHLLVKRKRVHAVVRAAPEIDPLEWLRGQLAALRAKLGEERAAGLLVDELTACLREYYARVRHEPVQAWTTQEFRHRLAAEAKAVALTEVLERCDELKFSGSPSLSPREIAIHGLQESERILIACGT